MQKYQIVLFAEEKSKQTFDNLKNRKPMLN